LKNVCGEFRGSELSAVMGPSGSGKSTLLDILSGFTTKNVKGSISTNELLTSFRQRSAYILQEQHFNSTLTVHEAMNFSIKFKTGNAYNARQQNDKIETVLKALGLELHMDTFIEYLSGGQQKRLSIALELVDDPLVLFLDEPTTGLDSSSSTQCIQHLKKLAHEGKTVICTIHTPSARLLEKFDNIYALANGCCIYQGTGKNLVSFLAELDFICPSSYNPSDFLLEIANDDYGLQNHRLTEKIQNGSNNDYRKNSTTLQDKLQIRVAPSSENSSTFFLQFTQLLKRSLLNTRRNTSFVCIRLMLHILSGISTGALYFGIGNEAEQIINNFKCIFFIVSLISYASFYSLLVKCEFTY
jgi:ATP-binding cassette subfamily G (WHITE) protein 1